ncbi:MAG: coenzyme F420-0:L-glutamate ligase [Candidatus Geothermarchaeales archaeon]
MRLIEVISIEGIPMVKEGDDVAQMICRAAEAQGTPLQDGDILVVTHKIVSKTEGRVVNLKDVEPSPFAQTLAQQSGRRPEVLELVLREAQLIIKMRKGTTITKTKQGWICANSGVDVSNVSGGDAVALLPENSDRSAQIIRKRIRELTGRDVAVIISDTTGRPLRRGQIDVAIGVAGIEPILDLRRKRDLFGYTLKVKQTAIVDEIASAAELVIGQVREMTPAAIIRGLKYPRSDLATSKSLLRPLSRELFR